MSRGALRKAEFALGRFRRSVPVPPECSLWELIEERTGAELPAEQLAQWQERTEREQQRRVNTLRALGLVGRNQDKSKKDSIFIVGLMTG